MRIVELLGVPGSGKSTTLGMVDDAAIAAGIDLQRLDPVGGGAMPVVANDPPTRTVAMARSSDQIATLGRAIVARPELAGFIIGANHANNPDAGPDVVMGMLLNHLIAFQLAEETMGDDDWLLLDEGLCNRVTSLFAAGPQAGHRTALYRYLSLIPVPDVLVVMATDLDVCFDRLEAGSWTPRLASAPADRRRAFLQRSAELVDRTRRAMEGAGARIVELDGTAPRGQRVPDVIGALRGANPFAVRTLAAV